MSERTPEKIISDEVQRTAVLAMTKLLNDPEPVAVAQLYCYQRHQKEKLLASALYALKQTVKDGTSWHVFIQEFAASLNRAKLLSNTNEQPFREWAYRYIRGV